MPEPTIRELLDQAKNYDAAYDQIDSILDPLAERVEAVLRLHAESGGICDECSGERELDEPWPCPTIRALEGDSNG